MEEDDVQYISVVFKNGPTTQTDEQTVYSEVKKKLESAVSAPNNTVGASTKPAAPDPNLCIISLLIVSLCLLLGCAAGLIYLSISMTNQLSEIQHISSEMSLLQEESVRLKDQRAELQNLTHNLNWTLQVILSFRQFPVSDFCPNNQCGPCMNGWLHFENSCYLVYESPALWKTWEQSQALCKQKNTISDLVIIDSLQEQEFIQEHIRFYYDMFHGYWIGLSEQADGSWVWGDGRVDTLGYWMERDLGSSGPKALIVPDQNVTTSWDPAENIFKNKFICESKALIID